MKPLGSWTRDLTLRIDQLSKWATTAKPPLLFWMSGFTFPTGFLTAVLQTSARGNQVILLVQRLLFLFFLVIKVLQKKIKVKSLSVL